MKLIALLSVVIAAGCVTTRPSIDLTASEGVNERVRALVGQEVCVSGVLIVDAWHGSYYELPRTHSKDVIALYGDRIVTPLRARDALESDLTLGENRHKFCGVLVSSIPDQNAYRLEPRQ